MRKVRLLFIPVCIFFSSVSYSQSVTPATLNASGGNYIFLNYIYEWSFGEMLAIETMDNSASNLIVTNGVLQPGTDKPATINNNEEWDKDEIKILPNPTRNWLEIDFFSKQQGKVHMTLFDATGKFLGNRQFDYYGNGRIEKWNLEKYSSGYYFLKIELVPTGTSVRKVGAFKVLKLS